MLRSAVLVLLATQSSGLSVQQDHVQLQVSGDVSTPWKYKQDCWQKRPVSLVQNVPGAGIDKFEAYKTVEKDGFLEADCVKDYMYSFGDKFGDNKFSYKLAKSSNVSIVHYTAHVAKEDRKPMSQTVCFEFCRTVPNMGFFGIVNGRDCYCMPYYKPMESDSSECDAVCEGENTLMCGGKSKSSVFSMHMCANTAAELSDATGKAATVKADMDKEVTAVKKISTDMQTTADKLQVSFGAVGDGATTGLLQVAKVFAGDLLHKAEDADKIAVELGELETKGKAIKTFTDPKEVTKAEAVVEDADKTLAAGKDVSAQMADMKKSASAPPGSTGVAKQYYPVMYFVDEAEKDTPQTCGGDAVAKPIVGGDEDGCAAACDDNGQSCVGYSFYDTKGKAGDATTLCFLFSKFETAFYYTGCGDASTGKASFMQLQAAPYTVKCQAKFSKFEGTTLKPDASGKCKQCLKKLTKADRCFK
jgi:hypothetical protein